MTDYRTLLTAADKTAEAAHRKHKSTTAISTRHKWIARQARAERFARWLLLSREFDPEVRE